MSSPNDKLSVRELELQNELEKCKSLLEKSNSENSELREEILRYAKLLQTVLS